MNQRHRITIESILREPTRPGDIAAALGRLLPELPRPRRAGAMVAGLTCFEVLSQVGIAVLGQRMLAGALAQPPRSIWALGCVALTLVVCFFLIVRWRHIMQERIAMDWRGRCVDRLSRHITAGDYEDLAAVPMAALREIVMTDAPFLTRYFVETTAQAVVVGFWVAAASAVLAYLSPLLLVVVLVLGMLFTGGMYLGVRRHLTLTRERFHRLADLSQRARDVAEVERVVLARQFGLGDRFVALFLRAHDAFAGITLRQARLNAGVKSCILMLNALGFLGVVGLGGFLVMRGGLEPASLLAAVFVVGQMLGAVAQLGDLAGRSAEAATAGKRLGAYWDARPAPPPPAEAPARVDRLTAENLRFGYGEHEPVIRGVSLKLYRGRPVALTAATGAGKSTLAMLLVGLLKPRAGSVTINGQTDLGPDALEPGRVLYVGPKPMLVAGSVRDNLFGGDPTDPAVRPLWDQLRRDGEPVPIDAPIIGPSGAGVSSGQAQIIQLARAVLKNPDVVIFDEATGSLDMPTERRLQEALLEWCRQRVCLVISHRPCPWVEQAAEHLRW